MKDILPHKILLFKKNLADQDTELILRKLDYNIVPVYSEEDAVNTLKREEEISVIIFECPSDENVCVSAASAIYNDTAFVCIPCIFITANNHPFIEVVRNKIKAVTDFLPLPLNPEILKVKINALTELCRKNRQLSIQEMALTQLRQELELQKSEKQKAEEELHLRNLQLSEALSLTHPGSWEWNIAANKVRRIFGTSRDITELKKTEQQLKIFSLMEKMLNEIFIFNWIDFTLLYANADALRSLGLNISELKEKHLYDLLAGYNKASFRKVLYPLLKGKKDKVVFYGEFRRKDNSTYPVEIHVQLIEQEERKVFLAVVIDLTERRRSEKELAASLKEKEILLKEIHHRVKNNLQIIYSLLNLQSGNVNDEKILNIFKESQNRIKSMALIHEKLYKHNNLSMIDFSEYLDDLVTSLIFSYRVNTSKVDVRINTPQVFLNIDIAISLGLCVTELVSNCFKYAFEPNEAGLVKIVLEINDNNILSLCVMDTGGKLPRSFDIEASDSLGLKLVVSLTEQHHGFLRIETGKTTSFIIDIPLKEDVQNLLKQHNESSGKLYKVTAAN
jgi:PAS domain S-box-containing protein